MFFKSWFADDWIMPARSGESWEPRHLVCLLQRYLAVRDGCSWQESVGLATAAAIDVAERIGWQIEAQSQKGTL